MRKFLVIILTLSFAGIAIFGLTGMGAGHHDRTGGCIASTVAGAACPVTNNLFDFIAFHLSFFKSFSQVPLDLNGTLLALTSLLLAIWLAVLGRSPTLCLSRSSRRQVVPTTPHLNHYRARLLQWLALLEKRDARLFGLTA